MPGPLDRRPYEHRVPARSRQIKGRRPKPTPLLILRERTKTDDYELLARSLEGSERQGARARLDVASLRKFIFLAGALR